MLANSLNCSISSLVSGATSSPCCEIRHNGEAMSHRSVRTSSCQPSSFMKRSSSSARGNGTSISSASSSGGEEKCCISEEVVRPPLGEICRTLRWPVGALVTASDETVGAGAASRFGTDGDEPVADTAGKSASGGGADSGRRMDAAAESACRACETRTTLAGRRAP